MMTVSLWFFFIKNRFFSHTIHAHHSFTSLSLLLTCPYLLPPLDPLSLPISPFRKEQASKRQQENTIKQNIRGQGKTFHTEARQSNPTGGKIKNKPRTAVESEIYHTTVQESNKNTKLAAIRYTQRAWCRPLQALCLLFKSLLIHMSPA